MRPTPTTRARTRSTTRSATASAGGGGAPRRAPARLGNYRPVALTVVLVNPPPVAVDDTATTAEDTPTSIDVVGNDTDVDGGALTATAVAQPAHGNTTLEAGGTVRYTPARHYRRAEACP